MRRRSSNSARIRFLKIDYDEIINYLKDYAKDALRKGGKLIILYGSLARGDYTATSDADVLIISDKFKDVSMIDRVLNFIDPRSPIDIEPVSYTHLTLPTTERV